MDKIIIRGLKIDAIIGILPHEREYPQPLVLNITLEHDIKECARTGDLNKSINYAQVCTAITEFVQVQKARLIETLAEDICHFILQQFQPDAVTLSIVKTHAVLNTDGVGVEIHRTKED